MPEEKHKALDECDLHQNVTHSYGYEIKQRKRRLTASPQREWQDQESHYSQQRNDEHENQNQNSQIYLPVNAIAQPLRAKDLTAV